MRHRLYVLIFMTLIPCFGQAQERSNLDSMQAVLRQQEGVERVRTMVGIAAEIYPFDHDSTFWYLDESLRTAIALDDPASLGLVYYEYGKTYASQGLVKDALTYYQKSIQYLSQKNADGEYVDGMLRLGWVLGDIGNSFGDSDQFDSAIHYLNKAYELAVLAEDSSQQATVLANIGYYNYDFGHLETAMEYDLKALAIRRQTGDRRGLANSLNNLGYLCSKNNQHEQSLTYYLEALEINQEIGNNDAVAMNYHNIGVEYSSLDDQEKAVESLQLALDIRLESENHRGLMSTYNSMAKLYMKDEFWMDAIGFYQKALHEAEVVESKRGEMMIRTNLARAWLKSGQVKKAEEQALAAMRISEEVTYPELIQKSATLLHDIYLELGQHRDALTYFTIAGAIKDSLQLAEQEKVFAESEARYRNSEKQLTIENLTQKNALAELEKDRLEREQEQSDQNVRYLLIGAGVLAILAFLLWRIGAIRRKSNAVLTLKNSEIESQKDMISKSLQERETLLKEIHHRVKNNLQTVSSLLSLQSRYLHDPEALSALEDGQSRLASIALLHQRLYQNDDLSEVHFQEYVEQLAETVESTFEMPDKNIELELDVADCAFDIDVAVPLGLIINELLTNAYKYAFKGREKGRIKLSIQQKSDEEFTLNVVDNGLGLPADFSMKKSGSMGMTLVSLLSRQLHGSIEAKSEAGTQFTVSFKNTL